MTNFPSSRKHKRYPVDVEAKIRPLGNEDWCQSKIRNLSRGGFCMDFLEQNLHVGQVVEVHVRMNLEAHNKEHRLYALIVWGAKSKYGLSFV